MDPPDPIKIVVHTQRRRDGGLRAWSDDVPGLVLSHADPSKVMSDIVPAVETIMASVLGYPVKASPLAPVSQRTASHPAHRLAQKLHILVAKIAEAGQQNLEYVASPCPA